MAPPKLTNLHRQATELLALRVLDGTYGIGQSLPTEPDLGLELGVSRTTVRSAVRELAAKGMLDVGPSRGTRVRPAGRLEPPRCRGDALANQARRGSQADRGHLRTQENASSRGQASLPPNAQQRGARDDRPRLRRAGGNHATKAARNRSKPDVAFHTAILSSAGNEFISALSAVVTMALASRSRIARRRRHLSENDHRPAPGDPRRDPGPRWKTRLHRHRAAARGIEARADGGGSESAALEPDG